MPVDGRPAFPLAAYFIVFYIILTSTLALAFSKRQRVLVFIVLLVLNLAGLFTTTGTAHNDYSTGCMFGAQILSAIYFMLLNNPAVDFRRDGQMGAVWTLSAKERVYWALSLINSVRGIGWNIEVAHNPPRPQSTRLRFVFTRLIRVVWWYMLLDLSRSYISINPHMHPATSPSPSSTAQGPFFRCINVLALECTTYSSLNAQYDFIALVSVALGIDDPWKWPNIFGAWADSYTLRRFWGRTWHQTLRRSLASMGKSLARNLHLKPGSFASRYTQLYTAFILSGLMHCVGDLMIFPQPSRLFSSLPLFIWNMLAITVEDAVIAFADRSLRLKETRWTKTIGYVWVVTWFAVTMPWVSDWSLRAGMADSEILPVLMTKGLLASILPFS